MTQSNDSAETESCNKNEKAEREAEELQDLLAKLKPMADAPLGPVLDILDCRPRSPMYVQWRVAFNALRARGFTVKSVVLLSGVTDRPLLRACNPYPRPEVVQAFQTLLGGIPAERIFPCLKNSHEFQEAHAKDYLAQ